MKKCFGSVCNFTLALATVFAVGTAQATTHTWENSNVSNTLSVTNDWFTGGPDTQAAWTGGDPVSADDTTIQFFSPPPTAVPNTVTVTRRANLNNGGTAFKLGILTFSGQASSSPNIDLTMNVEGDPLNFLAATGTINLDSLDVASSGRNITWNMSHAIQLGTSSSLSQLTLTGNGSSAFNFGGSFTELQVGGGSKLIKSGSSTATISGAVTLSGGLQLNNGLLKLTNGGNAITGGFVLNGGTLGDNTGAISATTLNNNPITVNGWTAMGLAGGVITSGGITLNSGALSAGSNNSSITFNGTITGSGGFTVSQLGGGSSTVNLNSTTNSFTGTASIDCGTLAGTLNFKSLGDAAGAGSIRFLTTATNAKIFNFTGDAPLTLNHRKVEVANTGTNFRLRNQSSQALTINTELIVTTTGANPAIQLGGTGSGLSTFAGAINNGASNILSVTKIDSGIWVFSGNNTYSGTTTVSDGKLVLAAGTCLSDTNLLTIATNKVVQLEAGVKEKVGRLILGVVEKGPGIYGSSASAAPLANQSVYFLGTGLLYVNTPLPAAGTVISIK